MRNETCNSQYLNWYVRVLILRVNKISHYINLPSNHAESESLPTPLPSLYFHAQLPLNMPVRNLLDLLGQAAEDPSQNGILVYHSNKEGNSSFLAYKDLLPHINQTSMRLQGLKSIDTKVVLMYFTDHLDSITWFWTIVAAGGIPCICPPLSKDLGQRQKNVRHLQELLGNPAVITTQSLASGFLGLEGLQVLLTGKSYA
jgi:hypothetical protein